VTLKVQILLLDLLPDLTLTQRQLGRLPKRVEEDLRSVDAATTQALNPNPLAVFLVSSVLLQRAQKKLLER